jgi:hypothetical protein
MAKEITAQTVTALRMHSLLLTQNALGQALRGKKSLNSVKDIACWFGAMQSQDLASGKWSFGVRLRTAVEADIDRAIERAEVLRTWPMRGTIHFVPAEDAHWMLRITGSKALKRAAARRAFLGLDEATVKRAADLLGKALAGGKRFTRDEAAAYWQKKGIEAEGQRVYHLLWYTSQIGVACIGPNSGKEQTYVLLDEWVKRPRQLSPDEALCTLATRYFRSHGPVSQQDFMGWSGLTSAEAKRAIAMAEPELAAIPWNGKTLWMSKALRDADTSRSGTASTSTSVAVALPGFDEFMLGYKDRSFSVPAAHLQKIVPGNNGMFMPTLVLDGVVVGTWKREIKREVKKPLVKIQPQPFGHMPRAHQKLFDAAFERYAAYLGLEGKVEWE